MTSVYLMIEVVLPDVDAMSTLDRDNARRDVDNLIMEGLINNKNWKTKDAVFKHAVILQDDMPAILKREKYRGLPSHEILKQLVIEDGKRPAKERWDELVARGAIDTNGNVLLNGPWIEEEK